MADQELSGQLREYFNNLSQRGQQANHAQVAALEQQQRLAPDQARPVIQQIEPDSRRQRQQLSL